MRIHLAAAVISLMFAGPVAAADTAADTAPAPGRDPAQMQSDAMKLCERLAGTEREICVKQARENARMADPAGSGATPGAPGSGAGPLPIPRPESKSR